MSERTLDRHDLVWLTPQALRAAQPAAQCCAADPDANRLLADWVGAGNPLIVARQDPSVAAGQIRLGLALPPALGKWRLAFQVSRADIARCAPPPALTAAVIGELPPDWRVLALRLLGLQEILVTGPRILGSAAMQLTTGLLCLGPDSDLDLLLSPCDAADAHIVCRALAAFDERPRHPRVDGEIRNAAGEAVAWREFAADSRQVLVKSFHAVRLAGREDFLSGFRQRAGAST